MPKPALSLLIFLGFSWLTLSFANPEIEFRTPSPELMRISEKPWLPLYSADPTRRRLLKLTMESLVPMEFLAREEVHLAGFRMHAQSNARSGKVYARGISLVDIRSGVETPARGLPEDPVILNVLWSPDGDNLAFIMETLNSAQLWILEAKTGLASRASGLMIHAGMDPMLCWSGDSQFIWVKTVPQNRGPRPEPEVVPTAAIIRKTAAEPLPAQTHQGLLRTQYDVDQFLYFFNSRLTRIGLDGSHTFFGERGLYRYFRESPNGRYLLVERLVPPWSFLVTYEQFAYDLEVWDLETEEVQVLASAPLAEDLPYGGGMVRKGAREFEWRADTPATVIWVEALDEGNSYQSAGFRDRIYSWKAPFTDQPRVFMETPNRFGDILWHDSETAILISWNWIERGLTMAAINPSNPEKSPRRLVSFEIGNRYRHPGFPLLAYNKQGFQVLHFDDTGKHIYFVGEGASLQGNRPFLDKYTISNRRKKRVFRSQEPFLETPVTVLDSARNEILVKRESPSEPPAHYLWNPKDKFHSRVTFDANPYEELKGVQRQLLRYKRRDGTQLTANLYLPAGYEAKRDGPLPTLIWAYPRSFQTAENASQLKKSPHQFIDGRWYRPVIWVLRDYAVLDSPAMPIIPRDNSNPNDTFISQLVDSANAAVRELIRKGVSEEGGIALGGHSYGAFMTANLLAHTDLFCAGIARSGAYNRTLTPFGFQSEERSLWQAPKVYLEVSPFLNAAHINEPLLLLHGERDSNPGTFPIQSERLFHAINGLGGDARLILFPNEGHAIRGKESIQHMLWEMERWLDIHAKGVVYPPVNSIAAQTEGRNVSGSASENSEPEKEFE